MDDALLPIAEPARPSAPGPLGGKRDLVVRWIKALCLIGAVASTSIGCYGFWFSWHTYKRKHQIDPVFTLVSFYVACFGLVTTLAELDAPVVYKRFPFLASRCGRAATYIFIGSLAFVLGVKFARQYDSWYTCVAGGYMMAAGGLLAMSYLCVRSGDAGEYNAYRPPGFETPQAPAG
jgi:hypothetical protein